jgi:very-short-patch-repair endonuclease
MIECKICRKQYDTSIHGLQVHISKIHHITTKEYYNQFIKKENEGKCYCGKSTTFYSLSVGYLKFCSLKCSNNSDITKLRKKQSCLKNFGVENPNQSKVIKEKKKKIFFQNLGVSNPRQSKKVQEKYKQTCINKYGVDNFAKTDQGKQILRELKIQRIQKQYKLNEPIQPTIGNNERICINELQLLTLYKIQRCPLIIGYFPDGYISELKLIIEFDEKFHFVDDYTNYRKKDIQRELELAALGNIIFRIKEKIWLENKEKVINDFKEVLENV